MFRCASCGAFNRVRADQAGVPTCGRCKKDLDVSGAPQDVDAAQFERVVSGAPVPVVVDIWAPWCPPCRAAAPILERVGRELAGKAVVIKVNSDLHPQPSARLGVQGIPTFVVFRDGVEHARQAGLASPEQLRQWALSAVS